MRKRSISLAGLAIVLGASLSSCSGDRSPVQAGGPTITVGVTKVVKKSLVR